MQRFTIASTQALADAAFERMEFWGYNQSAAGKLDPMLPDDAALICFTGENDACYVRAYYNGQIQPERDGANFRVTMPAGWDGDLEITTADNIYEGEATYPDRSDVTVTGLAGTLLVDLDSGNVEVKLDPAIDHYAGCAANDACENGDAGADPPIDPFDPGCGCTESSFVTIENGAGQASNVTIDIPTNSAVNDEPRWYYVRLENEGDFSGSSDFVCDATIDCGPFDAVKGDRPGCVIDPTYPEAYKEFAEINYPGGTAVPTAGVQINATSKACANVPYLEDMLDYDLEEFPLEKRGNLRVCSGCL
jgi:hypothetical protein